jgi:DNA-binding beta-propeller fold protein YncE
MHENGFVYPHNVISGRLGEPVNLNVNHPQCKITCLRITDNGYRIIARSDKTIRIYSDRELVKLDEEILDMEFNVRDGLGNIVLLESKISTYDLFGLVIHNFNFTFSARGTLAVSDQIIYISDGESKVYVFDRNSRELTLLYIIGPRRPGPMAVDPDGYLLISEYDVRDDGSSVAVYDTATKRRIARSNELILRFYSGDPVSDLIILPDAIYVGAGSDVYCNKQISRNV